MCVNLVDKYSMTNIKNGYFCVLTYSTLLYEARILWFKYFNTLLLPLLINDQPLALCHRVNIFVIRIFCCCGNAINIGSYPVTFNTKRSISKLRLNVWGSKAIF